MKVLANPAVERRARKAAQAAHFHVSLLMRKRLCPLLVMLSTLAQAQTGGIPTAALGKYERVHEVRDYCRNTAGACPLVRVSDKVSIARRDRSSVTVAVSTYGDDLHVCEFEGTGQWSSPTITVRSDLPGDACQLIVSFTARGVIKITGVSASACEMYCGANASMYVDGLRKVAPK